MDDIEQATAAPGERRTVAQCHHHDWHWEPLYARGDEIPVAYLCKRCGAVDVRDYA